MPKVTVGQTMPDFTFETPFEQGRSLAETLGRVSGKTALVFLRYYGCTLCQYDIHQFAKAHAEITASGGQMLVVLQSDPQKLAGQMKREDLPFDIICDPSQGLYRQLAIEAAHSMAKMADLKTMGKIAKATTGGFKHGDYEGEELQLPATFVMTDDGTLTYVRYGTSPGDVPSPAELVGLLA